MTTAGSGSASAGNISPMPEGPRAPTAGWRRPRRCRGCWRLLDASWSRFRPEQALRQNEDRHHEEQEGHRVAPFRVKAARADDDELADDEGLNEAADHIAETTQHADHEDQRPELQADLRINVVLQHHQRGG